MNSFILTNQKISETLKTKEWHAQHIIDFVLFDSGRSLSERKKAQLKCWQAYSCIPKDPKDIAPVTNPYGFSLGMPLIEYPLVESKMEQMIGEFMTRGIKRKTYVLNKKAKTKKLNEMFDMICEEILREVNKELEPQLGFVPETENKDMELPPDIEDFFEQGYKTVSEQVSDHILNQVLIAKKQSDKIKDLYLDFLLYDECIANVEEKDSSPSIRKLNIFESEMDFNPDEEIQNDPQYLILNKTLGYNEIINTFNLSDEELLKLKSYMNINSASMSNNSMNEEFNLGGQDNRYNNWISGDKTNLRIRCVEMIWKSQKKISVKVSINSKTGKEIYKNVPDDYKKRKNDNVRSIWVEEKRFCLMCGPDIILEYGVDSHRASRIDDPKKDSLFAVGIRRNNNLSGMQMRSAAYKLLQLQDFASECLFELRLAMRRNNSRVLVYDAAQVPKQYLKSGGYQNAINRVMHHTKKDQFLIINSADKQSRYNFNQFTSLDLSTKGLMQDLFNMLALIEDLAGKFLGLSPAREGNIDQYESATGTERSVSQSTARTEVYVKPFESFVKHLLEKVLIKAKYTYEENELASYIFGDLKTKFFKIYPEFHQDDIGVYSADHFAEQKKKATIDSAAQAAFTNASTPDLILSLIETLNADTAGESEAIFKRGVKALNKLKEQEAAAVAEQNKAKIESEEKMKTEENALKREEFQNKKEIAIIQADAAALRDSSKNKSNESIKVAELENALLLAEQKNNDKK